MHPCKQCGRKIHTKCLREWAGDRARRQEQRQREGHGGAGGALEAQEVAAALEQAMQEKVSALVLLAQQEERHVLKTRSVTELQQHQARPSAQLQQEPRKLA
eukprot:TRINITY_DN1363_c0_g2_i4.p5 TRINITY_DN1363_c0_g2~~TRINITY_DN1363_c0_g2_i4.p5  ORF type:complete len:102 (+),score=38.42 TRINITY_DN1363_c0_g2_i4:637-942(+)